jgi:hypothetical protein
MTRVFAVFCFILVKERRINAKRLKNPHKLEEIDEELNCPRTSLIKITSLVFMEVIFYWIFMLKLLSLFTSEELVGELVTSN